MHGRAMRQSLCPSNVGHDQLPIRLELGVKNRACDNSYLPALRRQSERGATDAGGSGHGTRFLCDRDATTGSVYKSISFIMKSVLQMTTLFFQLRVLLAFWYASRSMFVCQLVVVVIDTLASVVITVNDVDVQRWLMALNSFIRGLALLPVLFFFGVLQIIHVKRYWARQLKEAGVIAELDARYHLWSGPVLGAEPARPIAFYTGTLSGILSCLAYMLLQLSTSNLWYMMCSTFCSFIVVSFCIIENDIGVSQYIANRYHFDISRFGSRAGHLQALFPIVHVTYRLAEVLSKLQMFSMLPVLLVRHFDVAVTITVVSVVVMVDYLFGVVVLSRISVGSERKSLHLLLGTSLLVANVVHFTDMPGFCLPAQRITRTLEIWRASLLSIVVAFAIFELCFTATDGTRIAAGTGFLLVAVLVQYLLKFICLWHCSDDLHSAVERRSHQRVRKLLDPGNGGETLDVDGCSKDKNRETPAIIAAKIGDSGSLGLLFAAGASVQPTDAQGRTCLHHAVLSMNVDMVEFLAGQRGFADVVLAHQASLIGALGEFNVGKKLRYSRGYNAGNGSRDMMCLRRLIEEPVHQNAAAVSGVVGQSNVKPLAVSGGHLKELFSDVAQQEIPPIQELISVTSLVLVHQLGPLANYVLDISQKDAPHDGNWKIRNLARANVLGQGSSGQVIEVYERGSPFWSFGSSFANRVTAPTSSLNCRGPRRFAMKLQRKMQAGTHWRACSEALALQRIVHPFIVRLEFAFQTPQLYVLVLELCPGGDLNRLLCDRKDESGKRSGLDLVKAARYMGQILLALSYLHEYHHIVYRDMKPANVLLHGPDLAKLSDFGSSVILDATPEIPQRRMSLAGTIGFLAPELIYGDDASSRSSSFDHGKTVEDKCRIDYLLIDAYSFGATLAMTLVAEDVADVVESLGQEWLVPKGGSEDDWLQHMGDSMSAGRLSTIAYDLLRLLLRAKPSDRKRLSDPAVCNHQFFLNALQCKSLAERLLPCE